MQMCCTALLLHVGCIALYAAYAFLLPNRIKKTVSYAKRSTTAVGCFLQTAKLSTAYIFPLEAERSFTL